MLEDNEIKNNTRGIDSRTIVTKNFIEEDGKFCVEITIKTFDKDGNEVINTDKVYYDSKEEYEKELEED